MQTELKLCYEKCEENSKGIPVIIAAAGSSSRMGGANKQFMDICGIPVLARTMLAFERCDGISKILVAARQEDIKDIQLLAERYMISKLTDIVKGGKNRQESVVNCIQMLDKKEEKVLIHDGARPLVSEEIIKSVISGLEKNKAVTCAVALNDTVKVVDENGFVKTTPDRNSLVSVQTPQGVHIKEYREALSNKTDLSCFTDDMSIMEEAGYKVLTVLGSYKNFKITTKVDIFAAEGLIRRDETE